MSDGITSSLDGIAQDALNNLVNQFARPLDFLRELAQNSMDAGTPRVDVRLEYESGAEGGVLGIHVIDYGEGMDEVIIDKQLTRLFSSNKEDDLTKIGKFGIGFTSIFAIGPEAVLLRTGRHGESWELLFHGDRTFEKRRMDAPHTGTHITLFKRMTLEEADVFSKDARFVLSYWCEHSNIPITFEDCIHETTSTTVETNTADPFAAFSGKMEEQGPERMDGPLSLPHADLTLELRQDDYHLVVGYSQDPRYGFYNGGLTLVNSQNPDVLGAFGGALAHLSFKLQSNSLEHTLTRDNVLQDDHWQRLMTVVSKAARKLRLQLADRVAQAVESGESLEKWHRYLLFEAKKGGGVASRKSTLFRAVGGEPLTLQHIEDQEWRFGAVLLHPGTEPLGTALQDAGLHLLEDTGLMRALLHALGRPAVAGLFEVPRRLRNGGDLFVLPQLQDVDALPYLETRFFRGVEEGISVATKGRFSLKLGSFGGMDEALTEGLVVRGPRNGTLFQRVRKTWFRWTDQNRHRTLLLNRHHPFYQSMLAVSAEHQVSSIHALVTVLLEETGLYTEKTSERMLAQAAAKLGKEGGAP